MWLRDRRFGDASTGTPNGTSPTTDWWTSLVQALPTIATSVGSVITQQDLLNFNTQLIAQGKPPMTADQIAALQAGSAPQVAVGLSTSTQSLVKDALIGGGLLVAGYLIIRAITSKR